MNRQILAKVIEVRHPISLPLSRVSLCWARPSCRRMMTQDPLIFDKALGEQSDKLIDQPLHQVKLITNNSPTFVYLHHHHKYHLSIASVQRIQGTTPLPYQAIRLPRHYIKGHTSATPSPSGKPMMTNDRGSSDSESCPKATLTTPSCVSSKGL